MIWGYHYFRKHSYTFIKHLDVVPLKHRTSGDMPFFFLGCQQGGFLFFLGFEKKPWVFAFLRRFRRRTKKITKKNPDSPRKANWNVETALDKVLEDNPSCFGEEVVFEPRRGIRMIRANICSHGRKRLRFMVEWMGKYSRNPWSIMGMKFLGGSEESSPTNFRDST